MADTKISALTAITGVNVSDGDHFVVVDTTTSPQTTKRITASELRNFIMGAYLGPESEVGEGQTVAYTDTAANSTAITGSYVDITCTTDAYIRIDSGSPVPAATSADYFCSAGLTYRFPITSGNIVSAIRATTSGDMHIHPVS